MTYAPTYHGKDTAIMEELRRISEVLQQLEAGIIPESHKEPDKPRKGMLRLADGTNWNPGSGAGLYLYDGAAWVLLSGSSAVAAGDQSWNP